MFVAASQHGRQLDLAARGKFDRIAEQVVDDLAQAQPIDHHRRRDPRVHALRQQHTLLARDTGEVLLCAVEHLRQRCDLFVQFELARLDLGEIEHVVDQAQQRLARLSNRIDGIALLGVERAQAQQFQQADHGIHRGADFVAHDGQEGALGLAAGFGGVAGRAQFVLGALAFGDIGIDRHEAAIGQGHAADLDGAAVAPSLFEPARHALARQRHPRRDNRLRVSRPELAAFGLVVV